MQKIDKADLSEQIQREVTKSRNQKDAARLHYYTTINWDSRAVASWEQFKGSWAYSIWIKQHQPTIDQFVEEQLHRFQRVWTN